MALVRYRPVFDLATEFRSLTDELNRLFHDASPLPEVGFVPAAELSETEDAFTLRLEVPGMNREDLNIEVTANSIRISGERKQELHNETQGVLRSEFRYGSFERIITLPKDVMNTEVQADYQNGILTLHLPKRIDESQKVYKVQW